MATPDISSSLNSGLLGPGATGLGAGPGHRAGLGGPADLRTGPPDHAAAAFLAANRLWCLSGAGCEASTVGEANRSG